MGVYVPVDDVHVCGWYVCGWVNAMCVGMYMHVCR